MILLIIFGVLFILGMLFIILELSLPVYNPEICKGLLPCGVIFAIIGTIGLLCCGLASLVNQSNFNKIRVRTEYQERITSINNTKSILESQLETNTLTILEISEYNNNVREFKTELKTQQAKTKSPWIGCLCCSVCNEFSVDAVNYLYIEQ